MATYYVSSVAGDGGAGTTWATAELTIEAGIALATADGDIVYVDSAHSESVGAQVTWNTPTAGTRIRVISVDRNGSTTTGHNGWLAGAVSTISSSGFGHTIAGVATAQGLYIFGVRMNGNAGNASANSIGMAQGSADIISLTMEDCTFNITAISATAAVNMGGTGASGLLHRKIKLINPVFILKNNVSNASINISGADLQISGMTCSFSGANKSATLFGTAAGHNGQIQIMDSDLSGYDKSGGFYFNQGFRGNYTLKNCKLSSTPGLLDATAWTNPASSLTLINVDSGDTLNVFAFYNRLGSITNNTAVYPAGGASFNGTINSWKIVTTSLASEDEPFITPWIHRWGNSTSAQTWTIEFNRDNATDMDDREIWAEFEYVSSASFPIGTLLSVRNDEPFDGTAADWATGDASWTQSFSNNNPQKISSGSITPAEKSLLRSRVFVGIASQTIYIDPQIRIA